MNTLESPRSLSTILIFRSILITVCVFASTLMSGVSAQSEPRRPEARLHSSTSREIHESRTRLISVPSAYSRRATASTNAASPSIDQATETERRAFEATNAVRARNGFASLSWDSDLWRMARIHSERMAQSGFFSHETPEGLRLKDRARSAGIRFQVIGENIAYNQGIDDPGPFAVQRWMISSGHRANILSREFGASGVGSFVARDGRVYLTQVFVAR